MNSPRHVILSNPNDPSALDGVASPAATAVAAGPRVVQTASWILRFAQNDSGLWLGHRIVALFLALSSLLLAPCSRAADLIDLGQGLSYLSIQSLADSEKALRSAVPGAGALVLDLRHVTANNDSVDALRATLAGHSAGTPLFILVSPATPPAVADAITKTSTPVLTLGVAGSQPAPKLVVKADPESDRRAYDALLAGTPVETLITGKIAKERFDEATLVQEFKNGNHDAEPPATPDPTTAKPAAATEKVPPLVDRVLQRAVHLHRALLALRH